VEEAEAFLAGRYGSALQRAGDVPVWARMNWLAHASPSELKARIEEDRREPAPSGSWAWAVHELNQEIVELAQGDCSQIGRLQRDCMVPLEMALLDPQYWPALPSEIVILAVNRLRGHPVARAYRAGIPEGPALDP
jgi:hypothetical protein